MKRSPAILALLVFLPLAVGATPLLHHHDDHHDAAPCQVCYLVKIGSVALAVGLTLMLISAQPARLLRRPVDAQAHSSDHHKPAAPRAPPAR
jgi:hypothetical protein